nr:zinc finger protein 862-like [Parasteatoda tepidariorum]
MYDWLEKEERNSMVYMFCKLCRKCKKKNPFGSDGCTSYKTTSLQRHNNSHEHMQAVEAENCRKDMKVATTSVKKKNESFIISCLKSALFLAVNELPNSLFGNLQQFVKIQGCENYAGKQSAKYEHGNIINELHYSIAEVIEKRMLADVDDVKVCAIICDETCDLAKMKHLGVNIRYVKDGSVVVKFLDNVHISDGTALTLMSSILDMLKNKNINIKKIVALGSDGANVMVGKKSGLATRLTELNHCLISVHCSAHRLALVLQNAVNDIQSIKSYNDSLKAIFMYFNASAVRSAKLMIVQKLVQETALKYPKLHSVRWLSLHRGVQVIYKTLDSLILFLESQVAEGKDCTSPGLLRAIRHIRFIYVTHILNDILLILTKLTKLFQYDTADLSLIKPSVDTAVTRLTLLKNNPGDVEKYFIQNLIKDHNPDRSIAINAENDDIFTNSGENSEESGVTISTDDDLPILNGQRRISYYSVLKEKMIPASSLESLTKLKVSLINSVLDGLKNRFPENASRTISDFQAFDPLYLQTLSFSEAKEKVKSLAKHFSNYVNAEKLLKEFYKVEKMA